MTEPHVVTPPTDSRHPVAHPVLISHPPAELRSDQRKEIPMSHRLIRILSRTACRARPGVDDRGMTTAEYAVGIMAACTFALVLLGVVKSDAVRSALAGIVQNALGLAG